MFDKMTIRQLQTESARALAHYRPSNRTIKMFSSGTDHDSTAFYKAVIQTYVDEFGDLPSRVGPGAAVPLLYGDA